MVRVQNPSNPLNVGISRFALTPAKVQPPGPRRPEDSLNLPPKLRAFLVSNAWSSVGFLNLLAAANPSVRLGVGEELREAGLGDPSIRGRTLTRLGQFMVDSADAEFREQQLRPNLQLVAEARHAAQNMGEKLAGNIIADIATTGVMDGVFKAAAQTLGPHARQMLAPLANTLDLFNAKIRQFLGRRVDDATPTPFGNPNYKALASPLHSNALPPPGPTRTAIPKAQPGSIPDFVAEWKNLPSSDPVARQEFLEDLTAEQLETLTTFLNRHLQTAPADQVQDALSLFYRLEGHDPQKLGALARKIWRRAIKRGPEEHALYTQMWSTAAARMQDESVRDATLLGTVIDETWKRYLSDDKTKVDGILRGMDDAFKSLDVPNLLHSSAAAHLSELQKEQMLLLRLRQLLNQARSNHGTPAQVQALEQAKKLVENYSSVVPVSDMDARTLGRTVDALIAQARGKNDRAVLEKGFEEINNSVERTLEARGPSDSWQGTRLDNSDVWTKVDQPEVVGPESYFQIQTIGEIIEEFARRTGVDPDPLSFFHDGFAHLIQTGNERSSAVNATDVIDRFTEAITLSGFEQGWREGTDNALKEGFSREFVEQLKQILEHHAKLNDTDVETFVLRLHANDETLLLQRPTSVPLETRPK